MAKSVSFNTNSALEATWQAIATWLSCNGELCGVGPTVVFASAAALFLHSELQAVLMQPGDSRVCTLETTLMSTMMIGMLSLMVHIWVCSMRFFQYYLDVLVKDSPNVILEMTTAGLLGSKHQLVALGPLTRFLRQQQPQVHITVCWFLSLCYADYVRKNYCSRFNVPYLEQWQAELHARVRCGFQATMQQVTSYVDSFHSRLHRCSPQTNANCQSNSMERTTSPLEVSGASSKGSCRVRRRASDLSCSWPSQVVCGQLLSQSSETTFEAIKKLTAYIKENRCSCNSTKDGGIAGTGVTQTLSQHGAVPMEPRPVTTRSAHHVNMAHVGQNPRDNR